MRTPRSRLLCVWFTMVAAVGATAGCQGRPGDAPGQPAAKAAPGGPRPMTPERAGARYVECLALFSQHDAAELGECVGERASVGELLASGAPRVNGRAAVIERARALWEAFPDLTVKPQLVLVDGDQLATIELVTGTNLGPILGRPAAARKVGFFMTQVGELDPVSQELRVANALINRETVTGQLRGDPGVRPVVERAWPQAVEIVVARDDELERANVARWHRRTEAWNAHDPARTLAGYADDAIMHDVALGDRVGKAAIASAVDKVWTASPEITATHDRVWGAGSWVVAIGRASVDFARYDGGQIKDHWVFYDGLEKTIRPSR